MTWPGYQREHAVSPAAWGSYEATCVAVVDQLNARAGEMIESVGRAGKEAMIRRGGEHARRLSSG